MGIVAYIRVSTDDQTLGAEAQEAKIRAYCVALGLEITHWVRDIGESGADMDRPGMQQLISMMRAGVASGVVVAKLDRLTRSVRDLTQWVDNKWGFVSVSEQLDTNSPAGRMMVTLLGMFAQFERETIVDRTKSALDVKRKRGEKLGGRIPFGYRVVGRQLIPDEREQVTVTKVRELRAKGLSLRDIRLSVGRSGRDGALLSVGTISKVCR